MRELERVVLLNITDTKWREHLYEMDYLQEGIHLRALAQRDPITAYRREAYDDVPGADRLDPGGLRPYIYRVEFVRHDEEQARQQAPRPQRRCRTTAPRSTGPAAAARRRCHGRRHREPQAVSDKVPRNAPCPCGSGKKYKKCHGATV